MRGRPGIERINFVGHRYLIEQLVAKDRFPWERHLLHLLDAGMGWERNLELLSEVLDIHDYDAAASG